MAKNTVDKVTITVGNHIGDYIGHPEGSLLTLSLWVEGENVSEISGEDSKKLREDIASYYNELVGKPCFKFFELFGESGKEAREFITGTLESYKQDKEKFKDKEGLLAQLFIQFVVDPVTDNIHKLDLRFYAGDDKARMSPRVELNLKDPKNDKNKLEPKTDGKRILKECQNCFETVFDSLDSTEIKLSSDDEHIHSEKRVIKNDTIAKFYYSSSEAQSCSQSGGFGSGKIFPLFKIDFKNKLSDVNKSAKRRSFIKAVIDGTFDSVRKAISSNSVLRKLNSLAQKLSLCTSGTKMQTFWENKYIKNRDNKPFDRIECDVGIILDKEEGIKILAGADFSEPEKFEDITDDEFEELYNIFKKSFRDCVKEKTKDHKLYV